MANDFKSEKEMFSDTMREVVATMKAELDEFSRAAAQTRNTATSAVKKLGADTGDQLNELSNNAQDQVHRGAQSVAKSVAANPLSALAIAAGAGYIFGLATRAGWR
jgi:ElaB/YqjD/DUF883 family membrane-anchored ribosome-binding protein